MSWLLPLLLVLIMRVRAFVDMWTVVLILLTSIGFGPVLVCCFLIPWLSTLMSHRADQDVFGTTYAIPA